MTACFCAGLLSGAVLTVLWWGYPFVGRLLAERDVLAADNRRLRDVLKATWAGALTAVAKAREQADPDWRDDDGWRDRAGTGFEANKEGD